MRQLEERGLYLLWLYLLWLYLLWLYLLWQVRQLEERGRARFDVFF